MSIPVSLSQSVSSFLNTFHSHFFDLYSQSTTKASRPLKTRRNTNPHYQPPSLNFLHTVNLTSSLKSASPLHSCATTLPTVPKAHDPYSSSTLPIPTTVGPRSRCTGEQLAHQHTHTHTHHG